MIMISLKRSAWITSLKCLYRGVVRKETFDRIFLVIYHEPCKQVGLKTHLAHKVI